MTQDEIYQRVWDLTLPICQANHTWGEQAFKGNLPTAIEVAEAASQFYKAVFKAEHDLPNFGIVVSVVCPILNPIRSLKKSASRNQIIKALDDIALCINIVTVYNNGVQVNYKAD